ncbi:MAG: hypothetical protein HGA44_16050, partial [Cellulomonadaceae bacterium]|nr:hypothetical protein [Cellulomonadaceae bacterium]
MTATAFLVHPEATADPAVVHWYVGPELAAMRCGAGTADAPTPLKCLVDAGVLAGAELADDHIATTLGAGRDWRTESAVVRHGVQDALRELADAVDAAPALTRDALLADVAR